MLENYMETILFAYQIEQQRFQDSIMGFPSVMKHNLIMLKDIMLLESPKVFVVSPKEHSLLLHTSNRVFPRRLPFEKIFIETDFENEFVKIMGIEVGYKVLTDEMKILLKKYNPATNSFETDKLTAEYTKLAREAIENGNFYNSYFIWGIDKTDNTHFFQTDDIETKDDPAPIFDLEGTDVENYNKEHNIDFSSLGNLKEIMLQYICNFLDFLNNPEVNVIDVAAPYERNLKRENRNQPKYPSYKLIRVSGTLNEYLQNMPEKPEQKLSTRFWVRGHFIRFKNIERYKRLYELHDQKALPKKYYVDSETGLIMRWILPYIKGEGILIDKPYILDKGDSNVKTEV